MLSWWYVQCLIVLQTLSVPCFLGGMSRGLLGRDSPIQCRQKRGECLKEADTIILLGMILHCYIISLLTSSCYRRC